MDEVTKLRSLNALKPALTPCHASRETPLNLTKARISTDRKIFPLEREASKTWKFFQLLEAI
jgi:hypothetical protein